MIVICVAWSNYDSINLWYLLPDEHMCVCTWASVYVVIPVLLSSLVQVVIIVTVDWWYQRCTDATSLSRWCCWISQTISLCECVCKRDRMRWSRTDTLTIWQRKCCNRREVHLPPCPLSLSLMLFVLLRWHDTLSPSPPPLPPVFSAEADALSITVSLSPSHPPHCFDCVNGRMGEGWMKADGLDGGV